MALADTELDDLGYSEDELEAKKKAAIPPPPPVRARGGAEVPVSDVDVRPPDVPPVTPPGPTAVTPPTAGPPPVKPAGPRFAERYATLQGQKPDPNDPRYAVPGWKKGLGAALGTVAGMFSPGTDPGTIYTGVAKGPYNRAEQQWEQKSAGLQTEAKLADTEAQMRQRDEAAALERAKAAAPPKRQYENINQLHADAVQEAIAAGRDPAKDPKVLQIEDSIQRIQKEPAQRPDTQTQEDQRYEKIKADAAMKRPVSPDDLAWAQAYEKRKTLAPYAGAAAQAPEHAAQRAERSYQYHSTQIEKIRQPIEQRVEKINVALDNLNQKTPAADALAAPEILTAMVGGPGSGLRMNDAEISRIIGGRSHWENLKAALNKWQLDPTKALSITPEQRKEMSQILTAAREKIGRKQKAIEDSEDKLLEAETPVEHRKIVNDMRHQLDKIDMEGAKETAEKERPKGVPPEAVWNEAARQWQMPTKTNK